MDNSMDNSMDNETKLNALRCVVNVCNTDIINKSEQNNKQDIVLKKKLQYINNELYDILWAMRRPDDLEEYYRILGSDSPKKYWDKSNEIKKKYSNIFNKLRDPDDEGSFECLMGMIGGIREIIELVNNHDIEQIKQIKQIDYDSDDSDDSDDLKHHQDSLIKQNLDNIFNMTLCLDS